MNTFTLAVLFALFALPAAARQSRPEPPTELAAINRVPVVDIRVTDSTGGTIPSATIRWRGPASSPGTAGTINGQFAIGPRLAWSAASGWRFTVAGPHRFEISADGYKPFVFESVDLQPGKTARLNVTLQPLPPRQVFAPEFYKRKLLELVAKKAPGAGPDVRIVGEPVVMPEAVMKILPPSAQLPEAIVTIAVYEKERFGDVGLVKFFGDAANSRMSNPGGFEQLEEKEWLEMTSILDGFFGEAADVTRGPERFVPYLPANMRQMLDLRGEKNRMWLPPEAIRSLSNDQLRRFVSLMFDKAVLNVWMEVSGRPSAITFGDRPVDIRRDPLAATMALETSTSAMRKALTESGTIAPERIATTQLYVRRLLGEGYIVRENPSRDGIKLPRGARMYTVMLGGPLPHVIVENGKLRVVAVDFF
jgi:hypothetical protein